MRRPMTAEQQLERSVLENKERDELQTIAQAMAIKTTSRTKKADIIDQILQATGVISGPGDAGNGSANGAEHAEAKAPARGRGRLSDGASTEEGPAAEAASAPPPVTEPFVAHVAETTSGGPDNGHAVASDNGESNGASADVGDHGG